MAEVLTLSERGLSRVIREVFPAFQFSTLTLADRGKDHIVAFVDDTWVFRFPRSNDYRNLFEQQLRLLDQLRQRTIVPVPHYEYISRKNGFGG
jgi:hypothetical protein